MRQAEITIIDMSTASKHDLIVLAETLLNVSSVLSLRGITLQIKKSKVEFSADSLVSAR